MRQSTAAIGTVVHFVLAPGIVAGLVPWWLTGWQVRVASPPWIPLRLAAVALILGGVWALVHAFVRFVVEGRGTPAPIAPTERLVVGGLYRHVRNPIYLALLAILIGQAIALWQPWLLLYATAVGVAVAGFVRWYEEPVLARRYGAQYEAYRRAVRAWLPRRRAWRPGRDDSA